MRAFAVLSERETDRTDKTEGQRERDTDRQNETETKRDRETEPTKVDSFKPKSAPGFDT